MAVIATGEPLKPNFDANPAGDMLRGLKSAIYDISSVRGLGLTFASNFTAKLCLMLVPAELFNSSPEQAAFIRISSGFRAG